MHCQSCELDETVARAMGFGPPIGGNFLKKVRAEIHRGAKNVGQAIESGHEHVRDEVHRAVKRVGEGAESLGKHVVHWGERFGQTSYKGWKSADPINRWVIPAFRNNPEWFLAIGTVLSYVYPVIGIPLAAAASIRIARNERKLRGAGVPGEDSEEGFGSGEGGLLGMLNALGERLLEWIQQNPLLAAGLAAAVYLIWREVR